MTLKSMVLDVYIQQQIGGKPPMFGLQTTTLTGDAPNTLGVGGS